MKHVIAIDGPAASGKSSVARRLAKRLGFSYVDSGAFYRTVTWQILRSKTNPASPREVSSALNTMRLESGFAGDQAYLFVDGRDLSAHLRDEAVNENVSPISMVPAVRETLTRHFRSLGAQKDLVMEGRDIGSHVFPDTPFKFYIDAAPEIRKQRRLAQGERDSIELRDRIDSSRPTAPLKIPKGAIVIDTARLSVETVVRDILERLRGAGLKAAEQ